MARPTSTFYRWCTNTANRVAASASARISGFVAGDPVPSGVHNSLMGFLSDWVEWLGLRPEELVLGDPDFLPWTPLSSSSVVDIVANGGDVTLSFASGDSGFAGFVLPIEGGLLTGVTINVSAIDVTTGGAGQATVTVRMRNSGNTAAATYTGSVTATGDTVIPVSGTAAATSTRDGLLYVLIRPGTETAHFITISSLTFTFAATP